MNIKDVPEDAFACGLLNKEHHDRLILDIEKLALLAGVPPSAIWTRMSHYCNEAEIEWVRNMRGSNECGLVFVGKGHSKPVMDKMIAITGVCMRNYTDARVMSVQDVLALLKADEMPSCSVLLIPNFCLEKDNGGDIASWQVSSLLGLLIHRANLGLKTVLYCASMPTVEKQYGFTIREHLEDKFSLSHSTKFTAPKSAVH